MAKHIVPGQERAGRGVLGTAPHFSQDGRLVRIRFSLAHLFFDQDSLTMHTLTSNESTHTQAMIHTVSLVDFPIPGCISHVPWTIR